MATVDDQQVCINHPNTPTGLSCSKCLRPICQQCAIRTPVGLRCADCTGARRARDGKWYVPSAAELVSGRQYALATLAALVVAVLGGLAWGQWRQAGGLDVYLDVDWSFWWVVVVTLIAGEAIGRITKERRSVGLQVLAAGSVLLAAVIAWVWHWHWVRDIPFDVFGDVFRHSDPDLLPALGLSVTNGLFVAMGMFLATRRLRM